MIVSSLEWSRSRPEPLQVRNQVLRIGSKFCIKFGNGNVGDLQLLPRLFFVRLEDFVERLIKCLSLFRYYKPIPVETRRYLVVSGDSEAAVLQLLCRKVRQDIGYISCGIGSRGE
jgi:hypothetical protein